MRSFMRLAAALAVALGGMFLAAAPASAAPAPVVTSVTPAADTTGSQVVVSGSNLTLPPKLKPDAIFFGKAQAEINSCAPTTGAASSCNVTVPPQCPGSPKRVDVTVVVGNLTSAISSGDGFTYTDEGGGNATACPSASPSGTATPSSTPSGTATPSATPGGGTPTPGVTPSSGGSAPALPVTGGVSGFPVAVAGLLLILVGGATLLLRRRRTR